MHKLTAFAVISAFNLFLLYLRAATISNFLRNVSGDVQISAKTHSVHVRAGHVINVM